MKKILIKLAYFALLCVMVFTVGYFSMGTIDISQWAKDARETAGVCLIMGGLIIFLFAGDD